MEFGEKKQNSVSAAIFLIIENLENSKTHKISFVSSTLLFSVFA